MKRCCEAMDRLIANDRAGFSVAIGGHAPVLFPVIRFVSFDVADQAMIEKVLARSVDCPRLLLASEIPISYCPWCGRKK